MSTRISVHNSFFMIHYDYDSLETTLKFYHEIEPIQPHPQNLLLVLVLWIFLPCFSLKTQTTQHVHKGWNQFHSNSVVVLNCRMVNTSPKTFSFLCPNPSEGSHSMEAISLQNVFLK